MIPRLTTNDLTQIRNELARRSLAEFAKQAWHVLEPTTPLKWGWVLDALAEHLQAVTEGEIPNLLANVPPGTMKSLLTSVIWPAWEWGPRRMLSMRYLGTSHAQHLAVRDNRKCRNLVSSEWYQARWPTLLMADQNSKTKFENNATGFREAMAFKSMTGSRGDRIILDDPISAHDANSVAALEEARLAFTETLPTRVNSVDSSIVVIAQRLNEKDVSGVILDMGLKYEHLMIPMRFEEDRRCTTSIGWSDPRTIDGELMFPDRFPESQVIELEKTLGSYGVAGQLQQRPAPRGGGMFKRADFRMMKAAPSCYAWVRAWDFAATDSNADAAWTVGLLMGRTNDGRFVISQVVREQASPARVREMMRNTAAQDGIIVKGSIPQDPGQAGKAQVADMIALLAGFDYRASPETGSKETRAEPLSAQVEAGNVYLIEGAWNETFLAEAETFPNGKWKDQIDAASRAFAELVDASTYTLDNL